MASTEAQFADLSSTRLTELTSRSESRVGNGWLSEVGNLNCRFCGKSAGVMTDFNPAFMRIFNCRKAGNFNCP